MNNYDNMLLSNRKVSEEKRSLRLIQSVAW